MKRYSHAILKSEKRFFALHSPDATDGSRSTTPQAVYLIERIYKKLD
jgi:hypothetical protein